MTEKEAPRPLMGVMEGEWREWRGTLLDNIMVKNVLEFLMSIPLGISDSPHEDE